MPREGTFDYDDNGQAIRYHCRYSSLGRECPIIHELTHQDMLDWANGMNNAMKVRTAKRNTILGGNGAEHITRFATGG